MEPVVNPYKAPAASLEAAPQTAQAINLVGTGRRLANFLLDYIFNILMIMVIGFVVGLFFGTAWLNGLAEGVDSLVSLASYFLYYLLFEYFLQKTPAKFITRTTVVNLEGGRPDFTQVFRRTLCRFIPFEAFSCFGPASNGWHDKLSKTYLVKAP